MILPDKMTPAMEEALGLMIFESAPIAHLFKEDGADIPPKAEKEQAFILLKALRYAIEFPGDWRQRFGKEIGDAIDRVKAKKREAKS